jgi:hypothetical protein
VVPIVGLGRERRRMRASLNEFSTHLGSGDWQGAVQTLREDRSSTTPSTFGALASGVEDLIGESERRWQARAELSADWYWETDEQHRLSWLAGSVLPITSLGWSLDDLIQKRRDELAFLTPPTEGWDKFHERLERHEPFRDLELHAAACVWPSAAARGWTAAAASSATKAWGATSASARPRTSGWPPASSAGR